MSAVAPPCVAELLDVLIVDAGLPGTGAAHHLQQRPDQRYAVLEARDAIGGPRDLFRYRGLRHYW